MKNYLIRRLLLTIPILIGVSFVNFIIVYMAPGTPLDLMVSPQMTDEVREALEHNMGLDAPVYKQYLTWMQNVLQGHLGYSYHSYRPVGTLIVSRLFPTFLLMGSALLLGLLFAIPLGILSALKPRSPFDYSATFFAFFGVSAPNFFLGLGLIYIVCLKMKLLPSSGMFTLGRSPSGIDVLRHLILPCLVLSTNIFGRFIVMCVPPCWMCCSRIISVPPPPKGLGIFPG
ncbi:hypothetical protein AGMMS50293_08600 [Spirochaetia bacterium]|nr:hypothetical protein AGMMS50293_08600 [Spirochaetia bacterium]